MSLLTLPEAVATRSLALTALVMAAATWRYRGDLEAERPAALVRFANGRLRSPESLRFTVYRSRDTAHPRKRHRRILASRTKIWEGTTHACYKNAVIAMYDKVSETERLCYVGHNFGSGVMRCNSLCRYFVGVLDKDSGQMEVYNAEMFNMQPLLSDNLIPDDAKDYQKKSYREKVDLCIEAFGTSKQKRALSSRHMNAVGNDIVSTAVTKAAANIIDSKGVTALMQDVAQDDVQTISAFLPPCHEDADRPEHVYKFEDILSPTEYEALRVPAAALASATAEDIAKKAEERSHCSFVLEELKFLPADEKSRDHKARCLWFLDTLIKFSHLKVIKKKHPMGPECPHIISRKLMKNFTSLTYNNGSVQNLVSASMKAKITAYVILLALHINNFQTDLTVLQNDMKLQESRILDIAKALRLKISKAKGGLGLENDQNHKLGTLSLPLPMQKAPAGQRKRKKIN